MAKESDGSPKTLHALANQNRQCAKEAENRAIIHLNRLMAARHNLDIYYGMITSLPEGPSKKSIRNDIQKTQAIEREANSQYEAENQKAKEHRNLAKTLFKRSRELRIKTFFQNLFPKPANA
jgi:hypothetical protein